MRVAAEPRVSHTRRVRSELDLASSVLHERVVEVGDEDVGEGRQCRSVTKEDKVASFDATTAHG